MDSSLKDVSVIKEDSGEPDREINLVGDGSSASSSAKSALQITVSDECEKESSNNDNITAVALVGDTQSESSVSEENAPGSLNSTGQGLSDLNASKDSTNNSNKKQKKKFRHGKKGYITVKEGVDKSCDKNRRVHQTVAKSRKRTQSFPSISKFFLPYKRPRKDAFIPPTKFLLGGNISDPLNLNSLQDEDINRAMNAVTPESSPLPTPPRHKAKIDVIIPLNIRDPLNLMDPLDNEEFEKRLEMQQRKPRKRTKLRRRTTENTSAPSTEKIEVKESGFIKEPPAPEPSTSKCGNRKRSISESENGKLGKDGKKLRRMDSLDKIVSPVVPQPGSWMRPRAQSRATPADRPISPTKAKASTDSEAKLPKFHPKNMKYQYGNYDRYYGYRNLNAMMDVRLQVFEMNKHLFLNKDVLDIGCNVGHISIAVAKNLGARSVVGVDIDPVLISRAHKNLRSFIPVPTQVPKSDVDKKDDEEKKYDCDKCEEAKCDDCVTDELKGKADGSKKVPARKLRRPKKNRKAVHKPELGQCYFPMSMPMLYGPLRFPPVDVTQPVFPYNITFKQGNYVPREDVSVGVGAESPQFDLILCLSTTKWMHLNWGDAGVKRAFRKMFNDLRPGGKLVLEAQNWASYKKKKRLTPTIYENYNSIELHPNKFREYLLSAEVGFSACCILGVPQHTNKGFRRPISLYIKGDFTPSQARWSDAHAPSSHHRPECEAPRRTVYAPVEPAYRPSDDAATCGAATPYSPNLDPAADDSPFYNPRSDSYAPSYEPPRPTVYATLGSPVGSASPAASPAPSPHSPASPHSPRAAAAVASAARVYLAPTPTYKPHDDYSL